MPRRSLLAGFAVVLALAVAYPVAFFGWYLTAERVSARITACPSDSARALRCPTYGEWRMADGSAGAGRIYVQTPSSNDVGRTLPARATSHWAVAEGVTASAPGTYAAIAAGFDVVVAGMVLVLRQGNRGRDSLA